MAGKALQRQLFKGLALFVGGNVHNALVRLQKQKHVFQHAAAPLGAHHNVGLGHGGRLLGKGLRVTARQHRHGAGVLALCAPQPLAAFFIAPRGDGAAVYKVYVCVLAPGGKRKAVLAEQLGQGARLVLVHLAAQRVKRKLQMAHLIFMHSGRHGAARPAIIQKEG